MEIYDDIAEFTYRDGEEWIIRDLSSLAARGDHEYTLPYYLECHKNDTYPKNTIKIRKGH